MTPPAPHATIDAETYSEAGYVWNGERWGSLPGLSDQNRGLKAVGTRNYVAHPSFHVLCWAYDLHDGRGPQRWVPPVDGQPWTFPEPLLAHVESGGIVEAWNITFDAAVWAWCVEHWGWPELRLEQQRCAMAKARASAYPGALKDAAEVLQLRERKDPDGDRLIRKLTVPRNPTKGNPALRWTPETAPDDFERLYQYNVQDVRAETEASSRIPDLTPHELEVWRFDQRRNARGMQIDTAGVENCIAIVEQATERANTELQTITGGIVQSYTEVAVMLRWIATQGCTLYALDEELVEYGLSQPWPPAVHRVLRIRQALAFGSVKKLYALRAQTTAAGRLCDQYTYYGAHTGLWNGRGVQPANLYKGRFDRVEEVEHALRTIGTRAIEAVEWEYPDVDPLEVVASCLRSLIIAAPGHRLISADFTAIQAVVTSALAGEEWRLEVFRTHGKIYEAMASRLTGKPIEEYTAYREQHGAHHPDRQLGKLAVLSADFGAWIDGWKRFGADKLLGSDEAIKAAILKTRDAIPAVVELWGGQTRDRFKWNERPELYGLEGCVVSAINRPGEAFDYLGITYQVVDDVLYCRPLSGGFIRYHRPRLAPSTRSYARPWEVEISYEGWNSNTLKGAPGWQRMFLYGGVLTQNVVSHVAREIQALALLRLDSGGYPIVMDTHDEQLAEVPDGTGSTAGYATLLAVLPDWARTPDGPWPIKFGEPWEGRRYGKFG